ncbi:MAG: nucleotidyltransferase domain-containing protein [Candidatus Cloacimonadales bacterium]|nr:nucleotidyltransferase domain-containing protein [Candidatus Cloacimonadales bacterium]
MDKEEIIRIARKYYEYLKKNKFGITSAYLFGSFAKGTNTQESDIDIALIFHNLPDEIDMQIELMKLRRNIDLRIEPHPFSENELTDANPFLKEIIKTGILIS